MRPAYVVRTRREMPQKPIDIVKWLSKVVFVVIEYQALVNIITQPTLSALFGSYVPVHTVPNTLRAKPQPTELTAENQGYVCHTEVHSGDIRNGKS